MNAEVTIAILTFIAFSIPIVGALWRLFSVREKLAFDIKESAFKLELLEQKIAALTEQQLLALNGIKELVGHIRTRTRVEEEKLDARLGDVESWMEKNTDFVKRQRV